MRKRAHFGFTYLAVLFALAISSVAMSGALSLWSIEEKRDREIALLFIGNQYRQAIASYYESTPGESRQYPHHLHELIDDRRVSPTLRHLRRPYADPVSGKPWALMRTAEWTISGVYTSPARSPCSAQILTAPTTSSTASCAIRNGSSSIRRTRRATSPPCFCRYISCAFLAVSNDDLFSF